MSHITGSDRVEPLAGSQFLKSNLCASPIQMSINKPLWCHTIMEVAQNCRLDYKNKAKFESRLRHSCANIVPCFNFILLCPILTKECRWSVIQTLILFVNSRRKLEIYHVGVRSKVYWLAFCICKAIDYLCIYSIFNGKAKFQELPEVRPGQSRLCTSSHNNYLVLEYKKH